MRWLGGCQRVTRMLRSRRARAQSAAGVAGLLFALQQGVELMGCRLLSSSVSSIDRQAKSDGSWLDEKDEPCLDVAVSSISQADQTATMHYNC